MIIKNNKEVVKIYKGDTQIVAVYHADAYVYKTHNDEHYLTTSKNILWINPWDEFDIYSNVSWNIK